MDDALPAALAIDLDGSFERLVREHQDRLYSIALRILGDGRDAEEVAQDAFVRAYRALATWEPGRIRELELRAWLATIAVNLCRNRLRRKALPQVPIDRDDGDHGPAVARTLRSVDPLEVPHAAAARRETADHWAQLLAELPARLRVPVVLRHVDGMSYLEMAATLGRPEGTLKAQVHRGLVQLRTAAEHRGDLDREELTA
jgi:RNA polymerase sigma-70 factor (ECF subfamily)